MNFYGRLCNLPPSRWARNALSEAIKIHSSWFKEIMKIREELGIHLKGFNLDLKRWKKYVSKKIHSWENARNLIDIGKLNSLSTYPVENLRLGKSKEYLKEKHAKEVCKFRTGQLVYEAKAAGESVCILCKEKPLDATHLLLNCPKTKDLINVKNAIVEYTEGLQDYFSDISIVRNLLKNWWKMDDDLAEILDRIGRRRKEVKEGVG